MQDLLKYNFSDSPIVIRNVFEELPSWSDIITDLDFNVNENPDKVKNLGNFGAVTHFGKEIPKVKKITDYIHSLRPNEPVCTSHIYISFLSISNTFGWHNDDTDVFFVQAIGSTQWEVKYNNIDTYILLPGDLIYIPKFIEHNTVPVTPRVGISIGFTE